MLGFSFCSKRSISCSLVPTIFSFRSLHISFKSSFENLTSSPLFCLISSDSATTPLKLVDRATMGGAGYPCALDSTVDYPCHHQQARISDKLVVCMSTVDTTIVKSPKDFFGHHLFFFVRLIARLCPYHAEPKFR